MGSPLQDPPFKMSKRPTEPAHLNPGNRPVSVFTLPRLMCLWNKWTGRVVCQLLLALTLLDSIRLPAALRLNAAEQLLIALFSHITQPLVLCPSGKNICQCASLYLTTAELGEQIWLCYKKNNEKLLFVENTSTLAARGDLWSSMVR